MSQNLETDKTHNLETRPTSKQVLLGLLLGTLFTVIAINLWIWFYLNPFMKAELVRAVTQNTDSLYVLNIERLNIRPLRSSIEIKNVKLAKNPRKWQQRLDTSRHNQIELNFQLQQISVQQIRWWDLIQKRQLFVGKILIDRPALEFHNYQVAKQSKKSPLNEKQVAKSIAKIVGSVADEIHVGELNLSQALMTIEGQAETGGAKHHSEGLNLYLERIVMQGEAQNYLADQVKIGRVSLNLQNYEFFSADKVYQLNVKEFKLSSLDSLIAVEGIYLKPLSELEFKRPQNIEKYKSQRLNVKLEQIRVSGIDFLRLLYQRELDLRSLVLAHLDLDLQLTPQSQIAKDTEIRVVENKTKPLKKLLKQLPFYVRMDTFQLRNGRFHYHENQYYQDKRAFTYHRADSVNILFLDLALGKAVGTNHQDKPLYSSSVRLNLKNYEHQTPDGIYQVKFESGEVSSLDSLIRIKNAKLTPLISKEKFAGQKAFQSLMFDASVDSLYAHKIDIERLAYRQEFAMARASLFQPNFKVFMDSRKPKNPQQKYQNFEQVLKSIPLYLKMQQFDIYQAKLHYEERSLGNAGNAIAQHQAEDINLKIEKIALGKASNELILENIDTKSLEIALSNYHYQAPNALYHLNFERLRVSSAQSFIEIDSLNLQPQVTPETYLENQSYRRALADIKVPMLRGDKIDFKRLILYQEFDWESLALQSPSVDIYLDKDLPRQPKIIDSLEQAVQGLSHSLQRLLDEQVNIPENQGFNPFIYTTSAPEFDESIALTEPTLREILRDIPVFIKVDTFRVRNASVKYREQSMTDSSRSGIASHHAEDINFIIPQITLGKATRYDEDSTRTVFYSENLLFTLRNYEFKDKNDQYVFSLRDIKSSLADSVLLIEQLRFRPQLSREQFIAKKAYQSTFVSADLQSIRANAIDLERLVFEKEFVINSLYINTPKLLLYTDKSKPQNPNNRRKTIEELLQAVPFYISIDTFALRDANFEYIAQTPVGDTLKEVKHIAENINLFSQKIELALDKSSQKREAPSNLLYTEQIALDLENYQFFPPKGDYIIGFNQLHSSLSDSALSIQKFYLEPRQTRTEFVESLDYQAAQLAVEIKEVDFKNIDFRKLLAGEAYVFEKLVLNKIDVDIYHHKLLPKSPSAQKKKLEELVSELKQVVMIDTLSLENIKLRYQEHLNYQDKPQIRTHNVEELALHFYDIKLDSLTRIEEERLLFADNIQLELHRYSSRSLDSLYQISLGELNASTKERYLEAGGLWIRPTLSDTLFFTKKGYQTDRFDTQLETLEFKNFDFRKALNQEGLSLEHLQASNLKLQVFRDKRFDKREDFRPKMLHEAFQRIKMPLKIDTFTLYNSEVEYLEKVPKGMGVGRIFLTQLEVAAYQIDNQASDKHISKIEGVAYLMGEGHITANVEIPLNALQLYCHYYGTLGAMKAKFFNYMIENNVHVRIKKGQITRVNYDVELKDSVATGVVMAGYRKLKIQVLKEDNHEKKRGFITFIGNMILRNRNNLERRRHRAGEVNYTKDPEDGFLKVLWRSLATGLVDTLK